MRKEKKFEDTDVFSYAAGMMGTVDMEANCQCGQSGHST